MPQTIARIKKLGKHFEILVDLEQALKFKKGEVPYVEAEGDRVFRDVKKGEVFSDSELEDAFKTSDINEIAKKIVKDGEVQVTQDYRDEEREKKIKKVVDFLATNAIDSKTGRPHTPDRIKLALEQAHVNIKNTPIDQQIKEIIAEISKIIPIKIETKRIRIVVPAIHTGKAYGLLNQYQEKEKWLDDGSLESIVAVPAGMILEFYDKLNSMTHGSVVSEEIKE
jgi:ribosome maturation protein SDO1